MLHILALRDLLTFFKTTSPNVVRLRKAAIDCDFKVKCSAEMCGEETSFTEEMIRDQAVYGLSSPDTQAKILALGSNLLPLKDVIAKAESEEQARLTQAKLVGNKPAAAAVSAKSPANSFAICIRSEVAGSPAFPNTF